MGLWRRGMQGPVDQSRCGKRGATMYKATRSTRAIFFRKRLPNTRPKLWSASSPLTNAGGGNLTSYCSRPAKTGWRLNRDVDVTSVVNSDDVGIASADDHGGCSSHR